MDGALRSTISRKPFEGFPNKITAATCERNGRGHGSGDAGGQHVSRRHLVADGVTSYGFSLRVTAERDSASRTGGGNRLDPGAGVDHTLCDFLEVQRRGVVHCIDVDALRAQ